MKVKNIILKFAILLLILLLSSCGGGSRGTGGTDYVGRVLNTDSSPRADVNVTVLETGDSDLTDTAGNFSIHTRQAVETATLAIEDDILATSVVVNDVSQAQRVELEVEVNADSNTAEIRNQTVTNNDGNSSTVENAPEDTKPEQDQEPEKDQDSKDVNNSGGQDNNSDQDQSSNNQSDSKDDKDNKELKKRCKHLKDTLGDEEFKKQHPKLYKKCKQMFGQQ